MSLSPQDFQRIATLAQLELSSEEGAPMHQQLNDFFKIVERMSACDTQGIEPLRTPLSAIAAVQARLRDDVVSETEDFQANRINAPAQEADLFLVPKVIE